MAQVVETPEAATVSDGATASFSIPFTYGETSEVVVSVLAADGTRSLKVEGVDYAITGSSGAFLPGKIPPAGSRVERYRRTPAAQPEAFGDDGAFRPVANENAFDKTVRLIQEERARGDRSIQAPVGEVGMALPPAGVRAGRLFVGGASGAALTMLEGAEEVVTLNAAGQAVTMPLTALFAEIGTTLLDDGEWLSSDNPASNDDGVWG